MKGGNGNYYKNKKAKLNIYTLYNTQWTDKTGRQQITDPGGDTVFIDTFLIDKNNKVVAANNNSYKLFQFPKIVPGFIPDKNDTNLIFAKLSEGSVSRELTNDPLQFNTSFIAAVPPPSVNVPNSRKGNKIMLNSFYLKGTVSKPLSNKLTSAALSALGNYSLENLTSNQVTYYLIYQQCKEGTGSPDWRKIIQMSCSTKVFPSNYDNDRVASLCKNAGNDSGEYGINRFTSPIISLNADNRDKYNILWSSTFDLDSENTQFNLDVYEKLKVAPPSANTLKKSPIQVTYTNTNDNSYIENVESGAVYLIRSCYGVYNELLIGSNSLTPTGTGGTLVANTSYSDLSKLYPSESFLFKLNYYDI